MSSESLLTVLEAVGIASAICAASFTFGCGLAWLLWGRHK